MRRKRGKGEGLQQEEGTHVRAKESGTYGKYSKRYTPSQTGSALSWRRQQDSGRERESGVTVASGCCSTVAVPPLYVCVFFGPDACACGFAPLKGFEAPGSCRPRAGMEQSKLGAR